MSRQSSLYLAPTEHDHLCKLVEYVSSTPAGDPLQGPGKPLTLASIAVETAANR